MQFIQSLRRTLYRWQQKMLYSVIKTRVIGPDTSEFNLSSDQPVVYALLSPSHAEQLVIDKEVTQFGWTSPNEERLSRRLSAKPFFNLYKRTGIFRRKGSPTVAKQLVKHASWLAEDEQRDIQIIPVRVFWGKAPDKEGSFLKNLATKQWCFGWPVSHINGDFVKWPKHLCAFFKTYVTS